ncbi:MAG: hypothetical protein QNK37_01830 [Acidobacteriota bacterium]|nr:hypothetical protein [Acidobacteriota bacterium]
MTSLFSLGFLLIPTVERILAGLPDKLWCEETMIPICLIALASIMLLVWDVARRRFRRWWKWDI